MTLHVVGRSRLLAFLIFGGTGCRCQGERGEGCLVFILWFVGLAYLLSLVLR